MAQIQPNQHRLRSALKAMQLATESCLKSLAEYLLNQNYLLQTLTLCKLMRSQTPASNFSLVDAIDLLME